jgi:hypothetical protein
MTDDQYRVLQALYQLEEDSLQAAQYDIWTTPADVAAALPPDDPHFNDVAWVRERLEELWKARKVLQVTDEPVAPTQMVEVELSGRDMHGAGEARLAVEASDCRRATGVAPPPWEQVALYGSKINVRYRSRVAEIARLLAWNYQRFNMAPSTGLLRYVRRRQERPAYDQPIADLLSAVSADIQAGRIVADGPSGGTQTFPLDASVDRTHLTSALTAVLEELTAQFTAEGRDPHLAGFQARSLVATLAGLYCPTYRSHCDAHVVTAGVGSGKTYAFQLGALVHVAYKALLGERGIQVLLLYPRVVLAANQFQDLIDLISRVSTRLGVALHQPLLDAGGQLPQQMGRPEMEAGRLFNAIRQAYQGTYQILISNLDTLARRLVHPESFRWLAQDLDLVVLDEVHILSGLYGAHARMLLRRLLLLRAACRLRRARPAASFGQLLADLDQEGPPYFIGASATISQPREHTGRILSLPPDRVQHLAVGQTQETGWVHHFFIRQRPEVSSMSAVTNATSCLIHNRRDGLFREYYQRTAAPGTARIPLTLTDLANPVQPSPGAPAPQVELRAPEFVHKTIGFCDSLDGVGRWATFVGDNERTKAAKMGSSPNPAFGELPYFLRFQEPLWRVVHHLSYGATAPQWQRRLWEHYGQLCQDCKRGCKRRVDRIPGGLTQPQRRNVETLWELTEANGDSYLQRLRVLPEYVAADWFQPVHQAAQQNTIGNLDECAFFQTGLCWWWSLDHLGSNQPTPASAADPPNGLKRPRAHPQNLYNFLNAIRLRAFTSVTSFDAFAGDSINDLFQASARAVFRDPNFPDDARENCALLIGSPRIEVGIDLDRASEGITFRALRDPASVQQKAGRVGREQRSDSVVLHIVTDNARDHFYFRNPRIALDPEYLQPIPLHAGNQIVARNHYFMAIVDFLCLQGLNAGAEVLPANGHRLNLVNDHAQAGNSFQNWDQKVNAVYQFLFGTHPRQAQNLVNLAGYLQALGATAAEITNPAAFAALGPADAPLSQNIGAVDVFRHEFGPNLMLTPLPLGPGQTLTLAQLCATTYQSPAGFQAPAHLRRHQAFLDTYQTYHAPEGQAPNPRRDRSYLPDLLTLPVFRRGLPAHGQPGDQPYLWTPALFEAVGNESVRVFDEYQGRQRDLGFERVGLALALLVPGTYTYRYGVSARKVPVARFGAQGLTNLLPRVEGVSLLVNDPNYYEPAACRGGPAGGFRRPSARDSSSRLHPPADRPDVGTGGAAGHGGRPRGRRGPHAAPAGHISAPAAAADVCPALVPGHLL